ncbi:hypothetical protein V1525DRAFT_360172 [Lipomyces kononenkoae]|uniref:Uncharacterized protein n=1 Tax=Lipomyces kononenkoae TaxID=34357 RepID=A0ACC3T1S1_LIPKO
MPASDAPPSVPLSFSNNFWGMEERGVTAMFQRMREAKQTCEEIKAFYKERIMIEDEYSRRLLALSRKALGSNELGTLRASLDTVRGETEQMGKAHANTATQIKAELEDPLLAFAAAMRERRKMVQTTLDKLSKGKIAQQAVVQKNRDRYENDCNKVNGYIAQQNMVMGRELEKNNVKLEKAQIAVTSSRRDYQTSLRTLAETTEKWNREWKAGCDKFQDLEEERIDFLKSNLWAYTNIMSTVCVSDDEFCENIRVSLEQCDIERDICTFVKERGTGQEIPDPPKYINFMDGTSYRPDHENYSLAQFSRVTNPQFRTSSPQPRTTQHAGTEQTDGGVDDEVSVSSSQPQTVQLDSMLASLFAGSRSDRNTSVEVATPQKPMTGTQANETDSPRSARSANSATVEPKPQLITNIKPLQDVVLPYPDEGLSSAQSSPIHSPIHRPVSMSGESAYSIPTTISTDSGDEADTPVKTIANKTPTKQTEKKGGWISPFRRRSRNDNPTPWVEDEPATLHASSRLSKAKSSTQLDTRSSSPAKRPVSPSKQSATPGYMVSKTPSIGQKSLYERPEYAELEGVESIDPRANVVLSVGGNDFDVTSSQIQPKASRGSASPSKSDSDTVDPIAAALAELKSPGTKSVEKYNGIGIKTANRSNGGRRVPSYSAPSSPSASPGVRHNEIPPPSHKTPNSQTSFSVPKSSSLAAPPQAITAAEMQHATNEYAGRTHEMFQGGASPVYSRPPPESQSRMRDGRPRSRQDQQRGPTSLSSPSQQRHQHTYAEGQDSGSPGGRPPSRQQQPRYRPPSRGDDVYFGRDMSPTPQRRQSPNASIMGRPRSAYGYAHESQQQSGRSASASKYRTGYDGSPIQQGISRQQYQPGPGSSSQHPQMYNRQKSKSALDMRPQPTELPAYSHDGREVIAYARAMYDYRAAIPEEVSFRKGDILLILVIQEDGWWEAEVFGPRTRPQLGLAPSNFCHML